MIVRREGIRVQEDAGHGWPDSGALCPQALSLAASGLLRRRRRVPNAGTVDARPLLRPPHRGRAEYAAVPARAPAGAAAVERWAGGEDGATERARVPPGSTADRRGRKPGGPVGLHLPRGPRAAAVAQPR